MKIFFMFFFLLTVVNAQVFPSNEILGSIGFSYGTVFERNINGDVSSFMGSPGIALNAALPSKVRNLFFQNFIGFPQRIYTTIDGREITVNLESGFQFGMILGRAFFFPITEKFIFQPNAGFCGTITWIKYFDEKLITSNSSSLGLGGSVGFVYRLSERFALNMGSCLSFDYSLRGLGNWARNFFHFTARPYVSVAVFTYQD